MAKTTTFDASGAVIVSETDAQGEVTSWTMRPDQAEKHLPTFAAHAQKLSAGDASAVRDAANEFKAAQALDAKNE